MFSNKKNDSFLNNPQQQTQEIVEVFDWNDNDSSDIDSSDNPIHTTIVEDAINIRKGSLPSQSVDNLMIYEQHLPSKTLESLNMEMNQTNDNQLQNRTIANPEITVINKTIYSNKCCIIYIIILNILLLYVICTVTYLLVNYNNTPSCQCKKIETNNTSHFIGDLKVSIQTKSHGYWLLCDGSYINKNEYQMLFNIFGYTFGSHSENISLFRLPNGKGKVIGIIDELKYNIGDIMGNENIVLGINNMPQHDHFMVSSNDNGYRGGYLDGIYSYLADDWNVTNGLKYQLKATNTMPNVFRSSNAGLGENVNVMQPTIFMGNLFVFAG
eukprot:111566_1